MSLKHIHVLNTNHTFTHLCPTNNMYTHFWYILYHIQVFELMFVIITKRNIEWHVHSGGFS